jgi:hypothetical protein
MLGAAVSASLTTAGFCFTGHAVAGSEYRYIKGEVYSK